MEISLGDRSYPVIIGPGTVSRLAEVVPTSAKRAVIVTQEQIALVLDPGVPSATLFIGDGESAKSLRTIEELCRGSPVPDSPAPTSSSPSGRRRHRRRRFRRGLLPPGRRRRATWRRRCSARVDAAIGGKTGVNLPEGKNLVGPFWQPAAVLCDTDTLSSLPEREWRSGLGEMAKYEFSGVEDLDELALVDPSPRASG